MTALFPEGLAAVEAPALVIAFLSPAYPMDSMAGELQAALGSVPLIGCSTSGELTDGRFLRHSLVLWALGGAGFSVRVGMGQGELGSLRVASRRVARCLDGLSSHHHRVLVLLADGLCGDLMEVVRGAYEVTGASVPLVGGCAGDDMAMRSTFPDLRSQSAEPGLGGRRHRIRQPDRHRCLPQLASGGRADAGHLQLGGEREEPG